MYISSYSLEDDPPEAIRECIEMFQEKFFKELFTGWEGNKGKFWVAGGCLRNYWENTEPRDIDIYTVDDETRAFVMSSLALAGAIQVADSGMSTVYEFDDLQFDIIKKHFRGPEETLWDFDLSPALCATDGESLFFEEHYFLNMSNRSLVLYNAKGGNTIERVIRYSQQGFSMSRAQIKNLINELGIEDTIPEFNNSTPTPVTQQQQLPSSGVSKSKLSFRRIWPKKKKQEPLFIPGSVAMNPNQAMTTFGPTTIGSSSGGLFTSQYPMYPTGGNMSASQAQTQLNIPVKQTMTDTSMYNRAEIEDHPF